MTGYSSFQKQTILPVDLTQYDSHFLLFWARMNNLNFYNATPSN
jgi:hypothetical protein